MEEKAQPNLAAVPVDQAPIHSTGVSSPPRQLVITIWAYWIAGYIAWHTKNSRKVLGANPSRGIMGEALFALLSREKKMAKRSASEKQLLALLQAAWRRHGGVASAAREPNKAAINRFLEERKEDFKINYKITQNLIRIHRYNRSLASVAKAKTLLKESRDGSGAATTGKKKITSAWTSHKNAAHFIYACYHCGIAPSQLLQPLQKIDGNPLPIGRIISTATAVRAELLEVKAKGATAGSIFGKGALLLPEAALFAKVIPVPDAGLGGASRPQEPVLTADEMSRLQKDVGSAGRTTGRQRSPSS